MRDEMERLIGEGVLERSDADRIKITPKGRALMRRWWRESPTFRARCYDIVAKGVAGQYLADFIRELDG
jgi:hypothetical protein